MQISIQAVAIVSPISGNGVQFTANHSKIYFNKAYFTYSNSVWFQI
jgi:hypothetical protein